jgi:hypothetical protein
MARETPETAAGRIGVRIWRQGMSSSPQPWNRIISAGEGALPTWNADTLVTVYGPSFAQMAESVTRAITWMEV